MGAILELESLATNGPVPSHSTTLLTSFLLTCFLSLEETVDTKTKTQLYTHMHPSFLHIGHKYDYNIIPISPIRHQ